MFKKGLALFLLTALVAGGSAFGQCCGTSQEGGCSGGQAGTTNCGREISQADAAALWENYCTETCHDYRLKGRCGGLLKGCGSGGFGYGNCNQGGCGSSCGTGACETGCGTGDCGDSGAARGTLFSKLRCSKSNADCGTCEGQGQSGRNWFGGRHRINGCGADTGCGAAGNCFGFPSGCCGAGNCDGCGSNLGCGAGCGCGQRHGRIFRFLTGGNSAGLFSKSAANCGCDGAYFDEPVGYEYGTSGMSSIVAGCGTN